jgi:hypothetical protein
MCDFTALIVVHDGTPSASEGHAQSPLNALPHIVLYEAGLPFAAMFLSRIEPADQVDHDQRTFECSACDYSETVTVKLR